jgi:hypothetical protein
MSRFLVTNETGGAIPLELNRFPDGQIQVKVKLENITGTRFTIKASVSDSIGLDILRQCYDLFSRRGTVQIEIKYAYGARSDKDVAGDYAVANVAAQFSELLYALRETIHEVLAPHSPTCLFGGCPTNNDLKSLFPDIIEIHQMIVFPDESAFLRYRHCLSEQQKYVILSKVRDQETGEILGLDVVGNLPLTSVPGQTLIVDDICDGGRTFMEAAKLLRDKGVKGGINLLVVHGIFSNDAVDNLRDAGIGEIWCTNSFRSGRDIVVTCQDVWGGLTPQEV